MLMTQKEIEADMNEAQENYEAVCTACAMYLMQNGMNKVATSDILHQTLDRCIDDADDFIDVERTKNK